MKRTGTILLCLIMAFALFMPAKAEPARDMEQIAARFLRSDAAFKKQAVKGKYKTMKDLGVENEILRVFKNDDGCAFEARVYYGADYYEAPSLTAYVAIDAAGAIAGVLVGETFEHTEEFLNQVTQAYLDAAYMGKKASASFVADAVSGATFSSDAVLYAVRLCSNYAANVFGWGEKDSLDLEIKKLMLALPGTYRKLGVDLSFVSEAGEIQYAAEGRTEDGVDFCALVVASKFVPENADNNMTMPIYQIWIDRQSNKVFKANMLAGRFYEGFEMMEDRLASYCAVEITGGDAFDAYTPGLVTDAPEYVVTSATGSFEDAVTGATAQGNDTSRAVRDCFIAAAQYYCAHVR